MTRTERRLKAIEQKLGEYADGIDAIYKKTDEEDRETTNEERLDVEEKLKAIKTLKDEKEEVKASLKVEGEVKELSQKLGKADQSVSVTDARVTHEPPRFKSLGEQFVESKGYQSLKEKGFGGQFSTGQIELHTKGTLLEGTGASPGTGGALASPVPQVVPGVVETLFQRLTVADLIPSGQTGTNTLRYVVEGTATSGAAGVAEGGDKPESELGLSTVDEPVKKIATVLPVADEMLEDAPAVQAYINGRLSLFVKIEEERQLLLGNGTNDLVGLTGRNGVNTYGGGTVDNPAVQIFKALNGTRGSALLEPDGIIMNPEDWEGIRLLTDTAGQFYGGGPFQGPYSGTGSMIGASGQVNGAMDSVWGKPVVVTSAIGAGTALLGSFGQAAQIFRRSGLTVEATNSHADYFTKNLVAIRAEERLALAVYRPSAFTKVVFG